MLRLAVVGVCRRVATCQQLLQRNNMLAATLGSSNTSSPPMAPASSLLPSTRRAFSHLTAASISTINRGPIAPLLSGNPALLASAFPTTASMLPALPQRRTVTKFSLRKGKRKTVKAVLKRFMRLDWGGWIRTRQGRHKKMWKKTGNLKRRLRQHVLVNGTQAWLLDKMVTPFWRRPKYYVDDPYRPYHSREEFAITRKQPTKYE